MPLTPFHVVAVWPLYAKWPHRWDVLALSCAAMMPDLEGVMLFLIFRDDAYRGIMHSFLGIATVNLVLTILAARVIVPAVAVRFDRRFPGKGWRRFAGLDFVDDRKGWPTTIASGLIGGLTHVLLDLTSHPDTPLLWPSEGIAYAVGPWATAWWANEAASAATGIIFVWMFFRWVGR